MVVKKVKIIPAAQITKHSIRTEPTRLSEESIELIIDIFTGKIKCRLVKKILIHLQGMNSVAEDDAGRIIVSDANGDQIIGSSSLFEIIDYLILPNFDQPVPADAKIFLQYNTDSYLKKLFNKVKVEKLL